MSLCAADLSGLEGHLTMIHSAAGRTSWTVLAAAVIWAPFLFGEDVSLGGRLTPLPIGEHGGVAMITLPCAGTRDAIMRHAEEEWLKACARTLSGNGIAPGDAALSCRRHLERCRREPLYGLPLDGNNSL
jgi:hypothetical protein